MYTPVCCPAKNDIPFRRKITFLNGVDTGKFMLTIFGAVAELEREYILQRQREGIAIAKEQGKYTGRKPKESPDFDRVVSQWQRGEITAVGAMRTLKMSKTTFYRRVGKDKRNISLE
ncbi:recombinase family protein [Anaerotruncus sp. X29]|nr:recombinase family protein [Anaerotruncus sp. X29]